MTFKDWQTEIQRVKAHKIKRNKQMAKLAQNPDFKSKHPDWCRDAQNSNYKLLEKSITEDIDKRWNKEMERRQRQRGNK